MYPGISDLINDFFGTSFTVSFPPTFGTLVAISFLLAAWTLTLELKRKEAAGLLQPVIRRTLVGTPASLAEIFWNAVFGFILGFKLLFILFNLSVFLDNPQGIMLSAKGNLPAGILMAGLFGWMKFLEKKKAQLPQPKVVEEKFYPSQAVAEITMAAAIGGLFGAKLFHMLEYWEDFSHDPIGMFFSGSGLTMYGGLIVGAISTLWYARRLQLKSLHLCDAAAPGLMLAYGTGRLGCQLSGDGDWGIVNTASKPDWMGFLPDWFWSYTYPNNVINEGILIPGCEGRHCYELASPVFPTPLYESIICIALFFVLWTFRRRFHVAGMLFFTYLLLNGMERYWIEGIRVNSKYHLGELAFTQAQLISLLFILIGGIGIIYLKINSGKSAGKNTVKDD